MRPLVSIVEAVPARLGMHTEYVLSVQFDGWEYCLRRRYSSFHSLHQDIAEPLQLEPLKAGRTPFVNEEVIQQRVRVLEQFIHEALAALSAAEEHTRHGIRNESDGRRLASLRLSAFLELPVVKAVKSERGCDGSEWGSMCDDRSVCSRVNRLLALTDSRKGQRSAPDAVGGERERVEWPLAVQRSEGGERADWFDEYFPLLTGKYRRAGAGSTSPAPRACCDRNCARQCHQLGGGCGALTVALRALEAEVDASRVALAAAEARAVHAEARAQALRISQGTDAREDRGEQEGPGRLEGRGRLGHEALRSGVEPGMAGMGVREQVGELASAQVGELDEEYDGEVLWEVCSLAETQLASRELVDVQDVGGAQGNGCAHARADKYEDKCEGKMECEERCDDGSVGRAGVIGSPTTSMGSSTCHDSSFSAPLQTRPAAFNPPRRSSPSLSPKHDRLTHSPRSTQSPQPQTPPQETGAQQLKQPKQQNPPQPPQPPQPPAVRDSSHERERQGCIATPPRYFSAVSHSPVPSLGSSPAMLPSSSAASSPELSSKSSRESPLESPPASLPQASPACFRRHIGDIGASDACLRGPLCAAARALAAHGLAANRAGAVDEARRCFEEAFVLDPSRPALLISAANMRAKLGDTAAAVTFYKHALSMPSLSTEHARVVQAKLHIARSDEF